MHTIAGLRKILDLSTTNQVRNRIDAIKDILSDHLRRGPNNQILVTDDGVELLRQLQELYDSGLTMTEASDVLRAKAYPPRTTGLEASVGFVSRDAKPNETEFATRFLREEIALLRDRIARLEAEMRSGTPHAASPSGEWWAHLREGLDGS